MSKTEKKSNNVWFGDFDPQKLKEFEDLKKRQKPLKFGKSGKKKKQKKVLKDFWHIPIPKIPEPNEPLQTNEPDQTNVDEFTKCIENEQTITKCIEPTIVKCLDSEPIQIEEPIKCLEPNYHQSEIQSIKRALENHDKIILVYGRIGIGKTYCIEQALKELNLEYVNINFFDYEKPDLLYTDLNALIIRSNFICIIDGIDEYDPTYISEFLKFVNNVILCKLPKTKKGKRQKRPTIKFKTNQIILTTTNYYSRKMFKIKPYSDKTIEIKGLNFNQRMTLAKSRFPPQGHDNERMVDIVRSCDVDLHAMFTQLSVMLLDGDNHKEITIFERCSKLLSATTTMTFQQYEQLWNNNEITFNDDDNDNGDDESNIFTKQFSQESCDGIERSLYNSYLNFTPVKTENYRNWTTDVSQAWSDYDMTRNNSLITSALYAYLKEWFIKPRTSFVDIRKTFPLPPRFCGVAKFDSEWFFVQPDIEKLQFLHRFHQEEMNKYKNNPNGYNPNRSYSIDNAFNYKNDEVIASKEFRKYIEENQLKISNCIAYDWKVPNDDQSNFDDTL